MKWEGLLFAIGTVFFAVTAIVYWALSGEVIGTTCLALAGGLMFLIGFYSLYTGRRIGARPEDRKDAEVYEADPDYGFFSPNSWWPLPLAASIGVVAVGFCVAVWIVIVGVVLLMISLVGFYFEYYRGAWAE
ncbi:MAG TPA: cytochrome c oxidase subunit 4 [Candidatus Nanopelagicales bacterium]|jgi:hypothetical protein